MIFMKLRYISIFLFFVIAFFLASEIMKKRNIEKYTQQSLYEVAVLARKTSTAVNTEHLKCLATNIYWEAGSEPFMGQVAVARVVINRIKHGFGSNPCKVIYQTSIVPDLNSNDGIKKICQFSWVCQRTTNPNYNSARYKQAEDIARMVLTQNKWHDVLPNNVLFFHSTSVDPGWLYKYVTTIGNHVFYKK